MISQKVKKFEEYKYCFYCTYSLSSKESQVKPHSVWRQLFYYYCFIQVVELFNTPNLNYASTYCRLDKVVQQLSSNHSPSKLQFKLQTVIDFQSFPVISGSVNQWLDCLSHYICIMMIHRFNYRKVHASFIFSGVDILIKMFKGPSMSLIFLSLCLFSAFFHLPDLFPHVYKYIDGFPVMDWSANIVPTPGKQLLFMFCCHAIYTRILPLSYVQKVRSQTIVLHLVKCHSFNDPWQ